MGYLKVVSCLKFWLRDSPAYPVGRVLSIDSKKYARDSLDHP